MWIGLVSLFPEMLATAADSGVFGRALRDGVLSLEVFNPRSYARDRHATVDDRPYGGGPGMVMMVQPLLDAVAAARTAAGNAGVGRPPVVYLTPDGARLNQKRVNELAQLPGLVLVAGRYEGVDERFRALAVDEALSIGDYVLTGGELPAMVLMDAISRQLPGTLGNAASSLEESHLDGLLDYPHYTRPEITAGLGVPSVLLSGDHAAVRRWRRGQALLRTWQRRPDLLAGRRWSREDRALLAELLASPSVQKPSDAGVGVAGSVGADASARGSARGASETSNPDEPDSRESGP